jgi:hypothetical protein
VKLGKQLALDELLAMVEINMQLEHWIFPKSGAYMPIL